MEPAQCPQGGNLVEVGTDRNRDGDLDESEVQTTLAVCDGYDALLRSRRLEPGGECESGGVQIATGRDDGDPAGTAHDGELQPEEIDTNYNLCDDVLVSGGRGSCSLAIPGQGVGAGSRGWGLCWDC